MNYQDRPWLCHVRTRFFSGGFRFDSFEQALGYARQQWEHNEENVVRYPSYDGIRADFRAKVEGEGVNCVLYHEYFS